MKKPTRKLALRAETLRALRTLGIEALAQVGSGDSEASRQLHESNDNCGVKAFAFIAAPDKP